MKSKGLLLTVVISFFLGILFQESFPVDRFFSEARAAGDLLPAENRIPEQAVGNLSLFVLAGQSNMAGYGEIHPGDDEIDPRVFVFGNDYHWRLAREPIDDPAGQVDLVSMDTAPGFSCATTFAKTLLKYNSKAWIGLIPCAKEGSSIEEWQRNMSDHTLYGSCLKRARAASPMGKIKGLLFFQGETDALDPLYESQKVKNPGKWREKFSTFVYDIRKDLGIKDLPIVFAQIGINRNEKAFKNWRIVQEEQSKVHLPNCKMIKTHDLSLREEGHFDNKSYRVIGERFAQALMEIGLEGR